MPGRDLARRAARTVSGLVPGSLRSRLLRATGARLGLSGASIGMVSLVVVCERVDLPRLAETLASAATQGHDAREVLVAPVGADTARAAREVLRQRRDPRTRLLATTTTWQEAADRGAAAAVGDFLAFARGCDRLPPGALRALVQSLAASGSDLVVGTALTRGQADEWLVGAQAAAHQRPGSGLRPADRPELAGDLVVGNRLVRRTAWRAAGVRLGELDDWLVSPTVARLLATVTTVDVLDAPACTYLADHGNRAFGALPSSLPELPGWRERAAEVEAALTGTPLLAGWHDHVLDVALPRFLKDTERASDQDWAALRTLVGEYDARAGMPDPTRVRAESRTLLWLARHDRRSEAAALGAEALDLGAELRTVPDDGAVVARWTGVGDDVPGEVRVLSEAESPLRAEVQRLREGPDGREVDLFLRVEHLDLSSVPCRVEVALPDGRSLPVQTDVDPAADRWAQRRFQAALAATLTLPHAARTVDQVELTLTCGDLRRTTSLPLLPPGRPDPHADPEVRVDDVRLDGSDLVVTATGALRLVDPRDRVVGDGVPDGAGRWHFDLRRDHFGRPGWLPTGRYRLVTPHGNPTPAEDLVGRLPVEQVGSVHRLRCFLGPFGGLVVRLGPPLTDDEAGPRAQERLVSAYSRDDVPVDDGLFYFESYAGRSATDSPLAIYEELRTRRPDLRACWGVLDRAQWVPAGATPVLIRSGAWYDALRRAGCLVVNTDVEPWFRRRPGQTLLQTFHGYPSKGMGEVQWRANQLPPSRVATLRARGVDTWSAILTPTPEMTRHYREQYGYEGPAFDRGYPRDDALVAPGAEERRTTTRRLLGIGPDQTAVLYAPTWREHLATRPRGAEMAAILDVDRAASALGDSHVLLLRGHRFHEPDAHGPGVVDVTDHPEVNDLILAADVAVLDYSSLRFDFALTGKPMVFLVPDLHEYGSGTRSFLFPFEASAPGPFVRDTDAVVQQVRDLPSLRERWSGRIAELNATYQPWQDGHATVRVVDSLLELLGR